MSLAPAADWWTTFYQGRALEFWRRGHTAEETREQAAHIARALELEPGERVLDVPCGNGRLALELAARGHALSGVDASAEFVAEARGAAERRGLALELLQADMRALPWSAHFDAAFCAGNSFGYLDDEGNRAFLAAVAHSLRRGGRFLLEYPLVAELSLEHVAYRDWRRFGELVLLSRGSYDEPSGRLETAYTFIDLSAAGGAPEERVASYGIYAAREVEQLLRAAGFARVTLLGDPEGRAFDSTSSAFFALAVR